MGVPRLGAMIVENKRSHFWNSKFKFNVLLLDFNSIIYNSFNQFMSQHGEKCKDMEPDKVEGLILAQIVTNTKLIIDTVNPTDTIYIAIDGPVPMAKMARQRERRFKDDTPVIKSFRSKLKSNFGRESIECWNTAYITPGTRFMEKLSETLENAIKKGIFGKYHFILSDSNVPGEGEHKFIPFLKKIDKEGNNSSKSKSSINVCIYSPDADVFIIQLRFKNIHSYVIKSVDDYPDIRHRYRNTDFFYISMWKYVEHIIAKLGLQDFDHRKIMIDYVFLSFFGGNDFVHELPFLKMKEYGAFDTILGIYKRILKSTNRHLVTLTESDATIDTQFFRQFMEDLSHMEDRKMKDKYMRMKRHNSTKTSNQEKELDGYDLEYSRFQHRYFYDKKNPLYEHYKTIFEKIDYSKPPQQWKRQYYQHFFGFTDYHNEIDNVCEKYIKALLFTLKYYLQELPSWTFHYPYRVSPFPYEILNYMKKNNIKNLNILGKFEKGGPVSPFEQLMLVTHPSRTGILPDQYLMAMRNEDIRAYFPEEYNLNVLAGTKFIYSEPILPEIDVNAVLAKIRPLRNRLTAEEKRRNRLNNSPKVF